MILMLDFSIFTLVEKQSMSLHKDFRCSFHSLWKPLSVCYQNYSRLFLQLDYQQSTSSMSTTKNQNIKNFDNQDRIFTLVEKQVHIFLHKDFDVAFTHVGNLLLVDQFSELLQLVSRKLSPHISNERHNFSPCESPPAAANQFIFKTRLLLFMQVQVLFSKAVIAITHTNSSHLRALHSVAIFDQAVVQTSPVAVTAVFCPETPGICRFALFL